MEELVDMFVSEGDEMMKELKVKLEEKDFTSSRAILHKLKGSSSTFGS